MPGTQLSNIVPFVGTPTPALASASDSVKTFAQAAEIAIVSGHINKNTVKAYVSDMRHWLRFCVQHHINPWIVQHGYTAIFRDIMSETRAQSTIHRLLASIDSTYELMQKTNGRLLNPFRSDITARPSSSAENPHPAVNESDAARMFEVCAADGLLGLRDHAILALLWSTGVRREFIVAAKIDGWTLEAKGEATLRAKWKGGNFEDVRVPIETVAVISEWLAKRAPSEFLFCALGGRHLALGTINAIVKRRAEQAGVDPKTIMPHGFRAGFISRAYASGISEVEIQAAAKHKKVETTRGYNRGEFGAGVARTIGGLPKSRAP